MDAPTAAIDRATTAEGHNDSAMAEIGLLLYPGAQTAAIHGLTDLFSVANRMVAEHGDAARLLRISHWATRATGESLERIYDSQPGADGQPVAVVIPPSLGDTPSPASLQLSAAWVREQHSHGAIIGSVCMGAFVLAQTGLLDQRPATTHWNSAKAFAALYPQIRLDTDKPIIDDGDLITTAGLMAWAELGMRLVERLLGPGIATRTARYLLIEHRDNSECAGNFAPILGHGDAAILKVQHWLQSSGALEVSVNAMADKAGLEERTFLRRFRAATGLRPTEYCQHLRVGKAREMLEFTNGTVDHIAWTVGYQDPGAFRSTFKKITGFSPSDYRGRYGVRAT